MSDWDGETTAHAAEGPQWVSAAEAADAAGVTPGTVRYWARNGLIVSEAVPGPGGERTLVRLDEVLRHARQGGGSGPAETAGGAGAPGGVVTDLPARTSELAPILKSIPEIMAQLTAATDRAARAETKVEFLSAQLAEMRRRLAETEAGQSATPDAVVPAGWDEPRPAVPDDAESGRAGGEETATAQGWPAPPETTLQGAGNPASDAGSSIDWGSTSTGALPNAAAAGAAEPATPGSPGVSLEEIWAQPARREPASDPEPAPAAADVQWHEPASGNDAEERVEVEKSPAPAPPARRANADIPDETFYGPRRRRWFRRRR